MTLIAVEKPKEGAVAHIWQNLNDLKNCDKGAAGCKAKSHRGMETWNIALNPEIKKKNNFGAY